MNIKKKSVPFFGNYKVTHSKLAYEKSLCLLMDRLGECRNPANENNTRRANAVWGSEVHKR